MTTTGICVFRRTNLGWGAFLIGIYVNSFISNERRKFNMDYKELYFNLFNAITDVIEMLKEIQIQAEQKVIDNEDK